MTASGTNRRSEGKVCQTARMGACLGSMTEEEFTDMRQGVRNELGVDSSGGSGIRSYKSRDQGRSGKSRAASFFGENQTPRVHKAAPRLLKNNSIEFGVQARMTPLKDCSDEV
eukprot:224820-Prymnesium_polylepis.2